MFVALKKDPDIRYIDLPDNLKKQYQYFTEADVTKLRAAGYKEPMTSLEDSIKDYVVHFLAPNGHLGD